MAEVSLEERMHDTVFDVDVERLSSVYALAGLDAAGDVKQQTTLIEELQSLVVDVLEPHPQLEEVFRSALVSQDEKHALIDRLLGGKASDTLLNMLKVMNQHGRLGLLRTVVQAAYKLWEERTGKVHVDLEVPQPVSASLQKEILASLKDVLGADPQVTTKVNPDLLAGFVVRVGDRVFDASARTTLEKSRQSMLLRGVEAIENRPDQFINNSES